MNTIKSAFAVALMAVVLYGVYIALNQPESKPKDDIVDLLDENNFDLPKIERGGSAFDRKHRHSHSHDDADQADPSVYGDLPDNDDGEDEEEHSSIERATFNKSSDDAMSEEPEAPQNSSDPFNNRHKKRPDAAPAIEESEETIDYPPKGVGVSPEQAKAESDAARLRRQQYAFDQAFAAAKAKVDANECREALIALSAFYGDARLSEEQRTSLHEWLDALAGKVIYSTEHWLAPAYEVRAGETLYDVAKKQRVPFLLLQKINNIRDPEVLVPGTRLKVVPGPFRAEVDVKANEVTLFLGAMYAGRFVFTAGDEEVVPGKYSVVNKEKKRPYYGVEGTLSADDPKNPYGGVWIDLGHGQSIHGSPTSPLPQTLGCIGLAPQDADDLYGILSINSQVIIR